jgi:hypothetical protein
MSFCYSEFVMLSEPYVNATDPNDDEETTDPALLLCQRIDWLIEQDETDEEDDDQEERSGR